jgi:hypothetical protein
MLRNIKCKPTNHVSSISVVLLRVSFLRSLSWQVVSHWSTASHQAGQPMRANHGIPLPTQDPTPPTRRHLKVAINNRDHAAHPRAFNRTIVNARTCVRSTRGRSTSPLFGNWLRRRVALNVVRTPPTFLRQTNWESCWVSGCGHPAEIPSVVSGMLSHQLN